MALVSFLQASERVQGVSTSQYAEDAPHNRGTQEMGISSLPATFLENLSHSLICSGPALASGLLISSSSVPASHFQLPAAPLDQDSAPESSQVKSHMPPAFISKVLLGHGSTPFLHHSWLLQHFRAE